MVKIKWDAHRWETIYNLDNMFDYMEMMENQYAKVRKIKKETIAKVPAGLSEEEFLEWQSQLDLHEERYERDFPSKMRYSFLVLLHIIFETRLLSACNEISRRRNIDIKEKQLKGPPIERANIFLRRIVHIFPKNQKPWQTLSDLQKVRDCIVHANGKVSESRDKKHFEDVFSKDIGVSVDDSGYLKIERRYCEHSLDATKAFFNDLFTVAGFGPETPIVE